MTENAELMNMARESLRGKWGLAIATIVVLTILLAIASVIPLASLVVSGPFTLGLAIFTLSISRNREAKLEQIFDGFRNFGNSLVAYLLMLIFVLLWMLLLIIPGIIAAISYAMTFYIMADNPEIGPMDAIDKSKAMMDGYKWKYFRLQLRIFGWALLCILTLGIGLFWLAPWAEVSAAKFYDDIKDRPANAEVPSADPTPAPAE